MFNADLALSVTMTAISTLLSVIMLPANLLLYARLSYEGNILDILNWWALFTAIAIVIGAITLGLVCSVKFASHRFHLNANRVRTQAPVCCFGECLDIKLTTTFIQLYRLVIFVGYHLCSFLQYYRIQKGILTYLVRIGRFTLESWLLACLGY